MSKEHSHQRVRWLPAGAQVCLSGALLAGLGNLPALAQSDPRLEKLEQENQALRKRLDALEAVAQKEGILPSSKSFPVTALSQTTLSGFVTASYIYDTSEPDDNSPNGYLWNRRHNSFTLNKAKVTLASPAAERSGDKWDAAYRVSLIFGQDAPIVNTGNGTQGLEELREAFVELNVPLGTGLNVKAGQLISLLNFESGDGGVVNPNYSQGNQWFFTGNPPSAGVQLGYAFSDAVDFKVRVQNGMFVLQDNNGFKTFMGSLGIKPDSKTALNFIGFGGREGQDTSQWLKGGSFIGSRQLTEKGNLTIATEFDYFSLDTPGDEAVWWSIGGWIWTDFNPYIGLALRGDYLQDDDGAGTSNLLGFPANGGQDIFSLTATLNIRPTANVKIQPEIRYEHTSLDGGFDGEEDRFILGAGVHYQF